MKITLNTKASSRFAAQVTTRFVKEVGQQTSLEELFKMGRFPYFEDLYRRIAGEPVEFLYKHWEGDLRPNDSKDLHCTKGKTACQQAFGEKLVELASVDHEILLAIMTLRPKGWGKIHFHEEEVNGEKKLIAKYHDWSTSTVEIVEYVRPFLPLISHPTGNVRDPRRRWSDDAPVHAMRREIWEQYSLHLHFGEPMRSIIGLALAKKLTSFTACKLAYITAHSGNIGTQLFKKMCDKAKETEELRFVVNSLFDQGEKGPLWKKLKPLLRKLTASLK